MSYLPGKSKTGFNTIFPTQTLPRNNFNTKINPTPLRTAVIPADNSGLTLEMLAEEIRKLFRLVAGLEVELLKVQEQLELVQKDIKAIEKELASIQASVAELQLKVENLESSLKDLTETVTNQGKEIAKLQSDLKTLSEKVEKQESELETLKETVTTQGKTIGENTTAITQLQTDTTLLDIKTNFLDTIRETLLYLNDQDLKNNCL